MREREEPVGKSTRQDLSYFQATNRDLADSRFCDHVHYRSEAELNYNKTAHIYGGDGVKRLEVGMDVIGYDNKDKL